MAIRVQKGTEMGRQDVLRGNGNRIKTACLSWGPKAAEAYQKSYDATVLEYNERARRTLRRMSAFWY